MKVWMSEHIFK